MRIRKFRVEDSAQVARMHRDTIRIVNSRDYPKDQIEVWSKRSTAERFRKSKHSILRFVAVEKDKIIGFSDYNNSGELTGLYIHKSYQGKGVGKKLLKKIETSAIKKGLKELYLYSTITARDFYKKNGYKVIRKTKCNIGGEKLAVFFMKKKLQALT